MSHKTFFIIFTLRDGTNPHHITSRSHYQETIQFRAAGKVIDKDHRLGSNQKLPNLSADAFSGWAITLFRLRNFQTLSLLGFHQWFCYIHNIFLQICEISICLLKLFHSFTSYRFNGRFTEIAAFHAHKIPENCDGLA